MLWLWQKPPHLSSCSIYLHYIGSFYCAVSTLFEILCRLQNLPSSTLTIASHQNFSMRDRTYSAKHQRHWNSMADALSQRFSSSKSSKSIHHRQRTIWRNACRRFRSTTQSDETLILHVALLATFPSRPTNWQILCSASWRAPSIFPSFVAVTCASLIWGSQSNRSWLWTTLRHFHIQVVYWPFIFYVVYVQTWRYCVA